MAPQAIITVHSAVTDEFKFSEEGNLSFRSVSNGLEVIVGRIVVFIEKGSAINIKEKDLWWINTSEERDICTLRLIASTPTDVNTIHRLLLSLPPVLPPKTVSVKPSPTLGTNAIINTRINRTPSPSSLNFRNSLVLVDDDDNPVAMMDLNDHTKQFSAINQNDSRVIRGQNLAQTVDEIANSLFGRDALEDNEIRRRTEELETGHQTAQDGGVANESPNMHMYTLPDSYPNPNQVEEKDSTTESGIASLTESHLRKFSLSNLSLLTSTSLSILSLATRGSLHERDLSDTGTTTETNYATATEGGEGNDSRRSSSATFESCWTTQEGNRPLSIASIKTATGPISAISAYSSTQDSNKDDVTPRQSTINPIHSSQLSRSGVPSVAITNTSFINHPLSPSYTSTNAVLLEFLGNQSTLTTRAISTEEIEREGLVRASAESNGSGGWNWIGLVGLGEVMKGLDQWLGISSWFMKGGNDSKTIPVKDVGRGRLSVLYFDEQGFGRKAYVEGRIGG